MQNGIRIAAVIVLVVSLLGFWRNLPDGDLGLVFNAEAVQQAVNSGQMNLLLLVLFGFGIGASSNYLLTSLGMMRGYGDRLGRGLFVVFLVVILGGLLLGVLSNNLKGITVPAVMNPGMGIIAGSLIGLLLAKNLK